MALPRALKRTTFTLVVKTLVILDLALTVNSSAVLFVFFLFGLSTDSHHPASRADPPGAPPRDS